MVDLGRPIRKGDAQRDVTVKLYIYIYIYIYIYVR